MFRFEWDQKKDDLNRRKHLVGFETGVLVFDDPNCLTFLERDEDNAERWYAIGAVMGTVLVTVVHTYRTEGQEEVIQVLSARRASSLERRMYVEAI